MSRSHRKPVIKISSQIDKDTAHKKVRRMIKQELAKPEPDEVMIENDTRDIGVEEWGTKMDFTFIDKDDTDNVEWQDKAKRK